MDWVRKREKNLANFFLDKSGRRVLHAVSHWELTNIFLALIKAGNWVFLKQPRFTLTFFLFYEKPIAKEAQIVKAKAYWQPLKPIEKGWKAAKFDRARSIGARTSSVKPASERSGHWNGGEWDRQTVTALTSQLAPCNFFKWDFIFILNCHCLSTHTYVYRCVFWSVASHPL